VLRGISDRRGLTEQDLSQKELDYLKKQVGVMHLIFSFYLNSCNSFGNAMIYCVLNCGLIQRIKIPNNENNTQ
jgi:hypothetical protein